jgi:uncharacterized protein YPO0396
MTLVDIETVIDWLYNNLERYDLEVDIKDIELRNWYDLRIDLRAMSIKEGEK